jgi:hypothetical protein
MAVKGSITVGCVIWNARLELGSDTEHGVISRVGQGGEQMERDWLTLVEKGA